MGAILREFFKHLLKSQKIAIIYYAKVVKASQFLFSDRYFFGQYVDPSWGEYSILIGSVGTKYLTKNTTYTHMDGYNIISVDVVRK